MSWNASTGATSYKIYRCFTNSVQNCNYAQIGTETSTSFTDVEVEIRASGQSNDTFHYYVTAVNGNGESSSSSSVSTLGEQIFFKETAESGINGMLPQEFALLQNHPNPFNPETEIRYALSESGFVELMILNVLGRPVRSLVQQQQAPGWHRIIWDGRNDSGAAVASGVYFYRISVRGSGKTSVLGEIKKMSLVR